MRKFQIFVLAVVCSKGFSDLGQATCSTIKSASFFGKTAYYMEYFCCRNFEKKNGKCFECQNGFTTSNGEPCKPCTANKFGNKCTHTCHCTEKERCDSIHGCVQLHSKITSEQNESHHTQTYDYKNKTYSTDADGEHANDSDYTSYVIWTGCILFIILIVVSSSIFYSLNNNLLLRHSENVKSALDKGAVAAVVDRSINVPGPCDTINQQTICLDHDIEIQMVTKEAVEHSWNED